MKNIHLIMKKKKLYENIYIIINFIYFLIIMYNYYINHLYYLINEISNNFISMDYDNFLMILILFFLHQYFNYQ